MTHPLRDLLVLSACVIAMLMGLELLKALLRAVLSFAGKAVDAAVMLVFFLLIVPIVWLWERGRRPMWRTLTKQQSDELQAWLRRG
jgi:hypothetical protein